MPNYFDLLAGSEIEEHGYPRYLKKSLHVAEKKRAIEKILKIKAHLKAAGVPHKRDNNLLFCSWNLKQFGECHKYPEFYYYIAQIIDAFDLVVVQEVRRSIADLIILDNILGKNWAYVINDVAEAAKSGHERSAVLYNTRRVDFSGFSGELVVKQGEQLKRTPHITGFLTGWKHFSIINLHLMPDKKNAASRKDALQRVMDTLEPKRDTRGMGYENIILTGDFNFYPDIDDGSVELLKQYGFEQVAKLQDVDTTLAMNNFTYDRIFIRRDEYFEIIKDENGMENGGVVEFKSLFADDLSTYKSMVKEYYERKPGRVLKDENYPVYFRVHWLSRQMSDHYPIWFEMNTDSSAAYLRNKLSQL